MTKLINAEYSCYKAEKFAKLEVSKCVCEQEKDDLFPVKLPLLHFLTKFSNTDSKHACSFGGNDEIVFAVFVVIKV